MVGAKTAPLRRETERRPARLASLVRALIQGALAWRPRDVDRSYRLLFERNPQPMWAFDTETLRFLAVNERAVESYGYTREEFLSMTIEDIRPSEETAGQRNDIGRHVKRSGEVIDVEVLSDEIELGGRPAQLVVATDITARLEAERQLRHQADHDALTGLWNRRRLERELDLLLDRATPRACALIVFDVDHFKFLNDSFGHARGDELLKAVARSLRSQLEEGQSLARLGGDEFALLLPDTGEDAARELAARMLAELKCQTLAENRITASAGVAGSSQDHLVSAGELLVAADIALYEAKDAGRDRCAVAIGVNRGHTWIDEIREALADERLILHAQPIIDLSTGETVREELLVRMLDADGEVIPPASFIPASERFGLINEIDRWVVARALELAAAGRKLEVNLSAHSLGDREITKMVAGAVEQGIDPNNVVFEITETAAAANYREAADFAERLSRIGCGFALDDFGTGFGSLSYLRHVAFAYLKIDMEFVRDLNRAAISQRIVRVVVNIASNLGQKTIAEGVEDAETLNILRSLGVDYAQGFHIARPAPIELPLSTPEIAGRRGPIPSEAGASHC
jgi:diguanylate cyclase (GGDEF)-like protein/PAS domain S-box-containing protein